MSREKPGTPILTRLLRRVVKVEPGCWLWTGSKSRGYGNITVNNQSYWCHRLAYQEMVGPIPEGHHVHHSCANPLCLNPDHLIAVSEHEHYTTLHDAGRFHRSKTHCRHGHAYNQQNTRIQKDGQRTCRICERVNQDRRRRENPEQYEWEKEHQRLCMRRKYWEQKGKRS